jgi:hypothetical protein
LTIDNFTDKAIEAQGHVDGADVCIGRWNDYRNYYMCYVNTTRTTSDFSVWKFVAGTWTLLGYEAVDLSHPRWRQKLSISGTTLHGFRATGGVGQEYAFPTTPQISVTDTAFSTGRWGVEHNCGANLLLYELTAILRAPSSPIPSVQTILELPIEGSGKLEDPFRASLSKNLVEVSNKQVDLDSVSLGAFEFSEKSATNIIMVYGDNPYKSGAVQRQIDYAKSRNLRVFTPQKDYSEAVSLYNKLKGDFKHWIAGKDNFAYMVLGDESLDLFQNVDFYYGELMEHKTHYQQLKMVPDWDMRNRLNELKDKLLEVNVLIYERDKHLGKLNEILKRGW